MEQESPVEALKMRFVKGEITQEQYKEMLSALMDPSIPPAAEPPHPSYKGAVYIPPVSHPKPMPTPAGDSKKGMSFITFILALAGGRLLGLIVVGLML